MYILGQPGLHGEFGTGLSWIVKFLSNIIIINNNKTNESINQTKTAKQNMQTLKK